MRVDWCVSSWFRIKNTHSLTHGRVGMWDPRTGTGTVEAVKGQYTDAEGKCRVEALLFEEFGAMSAGVEKLC